MSDSQRFLCRNMCVTGAHGDVFGGGLNCICTNSFEDAVFSVEDAVWVD
jgi:hypothetical protein